MTDEDNCEIASPPLTDLNLNDEELEEALSQRSTATKQLLQRLQALHPSSDSEQSTKVEELESKCRELLEQVSNFSSLSFFRFSFRSS